MEQVIVWVGLGLAVSLLFSEALGLAAGGMVVPGYIALYLNRPVDVAVTLAVALVAFASVRGLSKVMIVYGRRRTVMMILVSFLLGALVRAAPLAAADGLAGPAGLSGEGLAVIGFVVPGLIAIWIDRQGMLETVSLLTIASVLVRLVLILAGVAVLS